MSRGCYDGYSSDDLVSSPNSKFSFLIALGIHVESNISFLDPPLESDFSSFGLGHFLSPGSNSG